MNWRIILDTVKIGGWGTTAVVWAAIIAAVVSVIRYRAQIRIFVHEVSNELAKASWPWDVKEKGFKRYKELVDSTMVVVIAMLLLSGYVAFWDFILVNVVGKLTGGGWH